MTESTKDKIKRTALSLFARRGYDGTTMNDIAKEVGIKTPSLYAHFKGKEELFSAIYEDMVKDHVSFMDQLINTAESMEVEAGLYYIFEQYIIHFLQKPEIRNFWTQVPISTPPELAKRLFPYTGDREMEIEKRMEAMVSQGIRQGKLRDGNPASMAWSHRLMRDGAVTWISVSPEVNIEKYIKEIWDNLWSGLERYQTKKLRRKYRDYY